MVHVRGYKLLTNLQNFTQKDLTEVKIFRKVFFWGGLLFSETPCIEILSHADNANPNPNFQLLCSDQCRHRRGRQIN